MTEPELKRCPFCGNNNFDITVCPEDSESILIKIQCGAESPRQNSDCCVCFGEKSYLFKGGDLEDLQNAINEVVLRWNTRAGVES